LLIETSSLSGEKKLRRGKKKRKKEKEEGDSNPTRRFRPYLVGKKDLFDHHEKGKSSLLSEKKKEERETPPLDHLGNENPRSPRRELSKEEKEEEVEPLISQ